MAGSVEKRIEDEGFLAAFGGGRRRIASVIWIEHAWPGGGLGVAVGRRHGGLLCGGIRRQVEAGLASAAPEREHGRTQKDDGPSGRAVVAGHDKIPNAAGTIQRLRCSGESRTI